MNRAPELFVQGQLRGQDLQGVVAGKSRVARQIDRAHTPGAQHTLDPVAGDHRPHS